MKPLLTIALFVVFLLGLYLVYPSASPPLNFTENYFIAANYYNSEASLRQSLPEIQKLITGLSAQGQVYVSFFENGSTDQTAVLLNSLAQELTVPHTIITCTYQGSDSWGLGNKMGKELAKKLFPNYPAHRYRKMAALRNLPLQPLYKNPFGNANPVKIIYLNDIYFTADQIFALLSTANGDFDMVCPMDYYYEFYDILATRDIDGFWLSGKYPYSRNIHTQQKVKRNEPFEVYSCWNGVAILNAEPFLKHQVEFRAREYNLEGPRPCECVQSECLLVCSDFRALGYTKIYVNPAVRVSYEWLYYTLHNLPLVPKVIDFLQSFSFEFEELSESSEATEVGCGMPPYWIPDEPSTYMKTKVQVCDLPFSTLSNMNWTYEAHLNEQQYTKNYFSKLATACIY